jgi:hypothetical protein
MYVLAYEGRCVSQSHPTYQDNIADINIQIKDVHSHGNNGIQKHYDFIEYYP